MMQFWDSLGSAGHLAIYAGFMSVLSVLFNAMAKSTGAIGHVGQLLVKIVDFFSANLQHKDQPK